jgi:hypothetical protein
MSNVLPNIVSGSRDVMGSSQSVELLHQILNCLGILCDRFIRVREYALAESVYYIIVTVRSVLHHCTRCRLTKIGSRVNLDELGALVHNLTRL